MPRLTPLAPGGLCRGPLLARCPLCLRPKEVLGAQRVVLLVPWEVVAHLAVDYAGRRPAVLAHAVVLPSRRAGGGEWQVIASRALRSDPYDSGSILRVYRAQYRGRGSWVGRTLQG